MKIGFPNHPRKNLVEEVEWIGRNKFDFVDLFLEEDEAVPAKIRVEKVKILLQTYGLGVVGHTAWYLPIGSPIESLREAAIKEIVGCFEVFSKIGAVFVTVHANWPWRAFSAKEGIEFQAESLRKLVGEAERHDLKLMYEPIDTPRDSVKNVSTILCEFPELFLNVDVGHANLFGKKPEQFVRTFHERIAHVHLHDNTGDSDLHLPMGCGVIDWEKTLKALKRYYDGTITLEVFSRDRDYVLLSKEKLRKLWSEI